MQTSIKHTQTKYAVSAPPIFGHDVPIFSHYAYIRSLEFNSFLLI